MNALLDAVLDVEIVELLDFDTNLPCEGVHHDRGLSGHDPAEPGSYMVISPCCGPKVIQCSSRVVAMRNSGVLYCGICKKEHFTNDYSFIPLPD